MFADYHAEGRRPKEDRLNRVDRGEARMTDALYISFAISRKVEESLEKLKSSDPDRDLHQNLISSSSSHTEPVHKFSSESVHNFLRYPVHKQTDKQG